MLRYVVLLLSLLAAVPPVMAQPLAGRRPHVLIFVADDAGMDFGCYGRQGIRTPHIDRLAREGLRATQAFLTVPQCSPSRISILSGQYAHTVRAEDLHMPLPAGIPILSGLLGGGPTPYYTGLCHKDHIGPHALAQFDWYDFGLDQFPAFLDSAGDQPWLMWVGFIDPHRSYAPGAIAQPHDPAQVTVPPQLVDDAATRADLALYYDEIGRMDSVIGAWMAELSRRQLDEQTLVIFLSDNGMPFPRAKGTLYDAGIQTPLILRWPGQIAPGRTYEGLLSLLDLTPTVLRLAGAPVLPAMSSYHWLDVMTQPQAPGRDYIFAERNWHDCDEHMRALRSSRYKLIVNAYTSLPHGTPADIGESPSWFSLRAGQAAGSLNAQQAAIFQVPRPRVELYDLLTDPGEFHNLSGQAAYRDTLQGLLRVLNAWMVESDDFPPTRRRRDDHTDRFSGVRFFPGMPAQEE